MRRQKKGQAAMEFLMTYGWAILAAVIVVGVLWFIIGNPANLAGNNFRISQPLVQKGMSVVPGALSINVLNGLANTMTVTAISVNTTDCTSLTGLTVTIGSGAEQNFTFTCAGLVSGERLDTDVIFTFREGSSTFNQQAAGDVTASVP